MNLYSIFIFNTVDGQSDSVDKGNRVVNLISTLTPNAAPMARGRCTLHKRGLLNMQALAWFVAVCCNMGHLEHVCPQQPQPFSLLFPSYLPNCAMCHHGGYKKGHHNVVTLTPLNLHANWAAKHPCMHMAAHKQRPIHLVPTLATHPI